MATLSIVRPRPLILADVHLLEDELRYLVGDSPVNIQRVDGGVQMSVAFREGEDIIEVRPRAGAIREQVYRECRRIADRYSNLAATVSARGSNRLICQICVAEADGKVKLGQRLRAKLAKGGAQ